MLETLLTVTRKIRHCKTCECKCETDPPIVGCESVMAPMPPLKFRGNVYVKACIKRIWFDKNYVAVDFWRQPTEEEWNTLSEQEWEKKLAEEFRKVQAT